MIMQALLGNAVVTSTGYNAIKLIVTANGGGGNCYLPEWRINTTAGTIPPNMTSNTAPSPFIASSSTGSAIAWRMFDSGTNTGETIPASSLPITYTLKFGAFYTVTSIDLTIQTLDIRTGMPKNFTVWLSSDNGTNWTLAKTVTNLLWPTTSMTNTITIP
jgi:hypothetical protein